MTLTPIPEVLEAIRAGKPVIVADDEGRENEGDAIMSAELASKHWVAWIVRNSSGLLCAPMSRTIADKFRLPIMVERNQDTRKTAYTITVDAAEGVTTGISASDRARTLQVLADPKSVASDIIRPGHILPLRAVDGGVKERGGHTEAAVDLMRMAGLQPVAVIAEIVDEDGDMMRMPGLLKLGERDGLPVTTIAAMLEYLETHPLPERSAEELDSNRIEFLVETHVPTDYGMLTMRGYRDNATGAEHLAIIAGNPQREGALVRVHSECLTGETLGSQKCECGPQLDEALRAIQRVGGVVLYLRGHEGRGIGLINKLRAYEKQEHGMDTLEANLALGFPADARDYVSAARMLDDLGIESVRLLSNNPEKQRQLESYGIKVTELVPHIVGINANNVSYLDAKRDRMGHDLPDNLPIYSTPLLAECCL